METDSALADDSAAFACASTKPAADVTTFADALAAAAARGSGDDPAIGAAGERLAADGAGCGFAGGAAMSQFVAPVSSQDDALASGGGEWLQPSNVRPSAPTKRARKRSLHLKIQVPPAILAASDVARWLFHCCGKVLNAH